MPNSLEYNVESALILLLNTDPVLRALRPRHSEFTGDREPTSQTPGNLQNPNLSVKCSKGNIAIPQSCYFNIDAEVALYMIVDEQTSREGIDAMYHAIESLFDDPALHLTLNANSINNTKFICEGTRGRKDIRTIQTGTFQRAYGMQLICVAKV